MKRRLEMIVTCLFLFIGTALAQSTISGTVYGDDGEPVIGATVMVKGNKVAVAVTDFDGNFSFQSEKAAPMLEISYIGFKTVTVKGGQGIKVQMESDSKGIGEVVVTGMQKMDKRLFTGATSKVSADKAKLDGVADVSRALEGRVAGVSVQNVSGTFGTAPKIRVRGATSIYGSSKPLWVVDG
ncbi:carboxypeptidase-like regulatory domain-containing protein, partial [Bacteroides heparinolyticus]|uniref:carboxypeptidase-like regulatory domain-containing protein n=1 Tax=Prevotella heparinolytica TaxID=28113 RepID=UPI0035A0EAD4